jgi:hypothetical protein
MSYYSTEIERLSENCEKTGKLDGEVIRQKIENNCTGAIYRAARFCDCI